MLYALGLVISGFVGTEIFSIFLHRYIFHGLLWRVHKSHHEPRQGLKTTTFQSLLRLSFNCINRARVFRSGIQACALCGHGYLSLRGYLLCCS